MNHLGQLFRVTSFGESHGSAVGCVVEGCPAGLTLDISAMQEAVNRRKTSAQPFSSNRLEEDQIEILSGIYNQTTLGTPITLVIKNKDVRSSDYDDLQTVFRPGHADYTWQMKYGIRDHRGGGRSSIRITAPLVAAGDLARQFITTLYPIQVVAYVQQIGAIAIPENITPDLSLINSTPLRCPHPETSERMLALIEDVRLSGDTLGGIIHGEITGVPVGLGEPVFGKLHASLAHALFNINTVKGVAFGEGFDVAHLKGSENNDVLFNNEGTIKTRSNHSGGLLGGISNGMPITFNIAFKPISSITKSQETLNSEFNQTTVEVKGRHDVCAVPRAVPIVEAYTNLVLADNILLSRLNTV